MKKINFNKRYGLETAVIERRKPITRRMDKRLNHPLITHISELKIDNECKAYVTITYSTGLVENVYPQYQIGEEVAVAQSYRDIELEILSKGFPLDANEELQKSKGWFNKLFVRADLMPHRIRITDIRVERLQDISDEDCIKEGIEVEDFRSEYRWGFYTGFFYTNRGQGSRSVWFRSPRAAFAALIDRISGRGTWDRNPWVWVYEFELIK